MGLFLEAFNKVIDGTQSVLSPLYSFFYDTIGFHDMTLSTTLAVLVLYTPLSFLVTKAFTHIYSPVKIVFIEVFVLSFVTSFLFTDDLERHLRIVAVFFIIMFVINHIRRIMYEPFFEGLLGRGDRDE